MYIAVRLLSVITNIHNLDQRGHLNRNLRFDFIALIRVLYPVFKPQVYILGVWAVMEQKTGLRVPTKVRSWGGGALRTFCFCR